MTLGLLIVGIAVAQVRFCDCVHMLTHLTNSPLCECVYIDNFVCNFKLFDQSLLEEKGRAIGHG